MANTFKKMMKQHKKKSWQAERSQTSREPGRELKGNHQDDYAAQIVPRIKEVY
ncbi:MAG: hypothetical protein ACLUTA_13225 [Blautia wexlerae]